MSIYATIANGYKLYKRSEVGLTNYLIHEYENGLVINTWVEHGDYWEKFEFMMPHSQDEFIKDLTEGDMFTILL